jgi:hypothetical protein
VLPPVEAAVQTVITGDGGRLVVSALSRHRYGDVLDELLSAGD